MGKNKKTHGLRRDRSHAADGLQNIGEFGRKRKAPEGRGFLRYFYPIYRISGSTKLKCHSRELFISFALR